MLNNEKNTPVKITDELLYQIPETLLGEFMEARKDKELLKGLNLMFQNYFQSKRYFDDENFNHEAVTECYHFCFYFLNHKELFNPKTVA
ncbi:hypothetical protein [Flavobacterium praedii]|uniref:hypothetical protein n=1 Tax=Flavobacterium praedii TaxID=3002900 RepID=UPI0024819F26|nr:hypothetical protein [Flavobacterium praedii]